MSGAHPNRTGTKGSACAELTACLEVDYFRKAQFWAWLGACDVQQPYGEQFPFRLSPDIS